MNCQNCQKPSEVLHVNDSGSEFLCAPCWTSNPHLQWKPRYDLGCGCPDCGCEKCRPDYAGEQYLTALDSKPIPKYDFTEQKPPALPGKYSVMTEIGLCDTCGSTTRVASTWEGIFNTCKVCLEKDIERNQKLLDAFDSADEPAHECPFAYDPTKRLVEKFTVQIETGETSNYCGCPDCRKLRVTLWRAILYAQITRRLKDANPFKLDTIKNHHAVTISLAH